MSAQDLAIKELAAIDEERTAIFDSLEKVNKNPYMATNRDPECTKVIIETSRKEIQKTKNLLNNEKELLKDLKSPLAEGVDDRIHLLVRLEELPTFKWNLDKIDRGYQPRIDMVAADSHIEEIAFGNLFCTADYLADILSGRTVNDILEASKEILMENEVIFSGHRGSFQCLYNRHNHPGGRAKWIYSLELQASKKYDGSNVLERIRDSGDYSALYGREGIQIQVKDLRIFRNERKLSRLHSRYILTDNKVYFPAIRQFFLDVVPKPKLEYRI